MRRKLRKIIEGLFALRSGFRLGGVFYVECIGPDGQLKWCDTAKNLIPYDMLDHVLNVIFHATTAVATWYVGLVSDNPSFANADVLSSHAGWTEFTDYTGNRQAFVEGASSSRSLSNSGNAASFPITGSGTVAGAFLCSAATGTSGTLGPEAVFTQGDKAVSNGDTVNVTYTITAADDGV